MFTKRRVITVAIDLPARNREIHTLPPMLVKRQWVKIPEFRLTRKRM